MTTGRAPDVARGPRALRDGYSLQKTVSPSVEKRFSAANEGPLER